MKVLDFVKFGGDRGARTPNLGIANAALSQLSYIPTDYCQPDYNMSLNMAAKTPRSCPTRSQ